MFCHAGTVTRVHLTAVESGRSEIPSVSIAISEPPESGAVWRLRLEAHFQLRGVVRQLGTLLTIPPRGDATLAQGIMAIGCAPGAVGWTLEVERDALTSAIDASTSQSVDVELSAHPDLIAPGLFPIRGLLVGDRYTYQSYALAAGASSIPVVRWHEITRIAVWQDGAGATMVVGGGNTIPISPAVSIFEMHVDHGIISPPVTTIEIAAMPAGGGGLLIERRY